VALHEYAAMWRDMRVVRSWRHRLGIALHGPGWAPPGAPLRAEAPRPETPRLENPRLETAAEPL
jgi:hypothetical protein